MNTTDEKSYAAVSAKDLINILDEKMDQAFKQIKDLENIDYCEGSLANRLIEDVSRLQQIKIDINRLVKDADAFKKLVVVQRLDEMAESLEEATV